MRSEFRFPKVTVTLMTIILAGVVLAIEKATAIHASVPDSYQHVGPIQPAHFTFLPTMLVIMGGACLAGAIGWAILFALHRSGVQRLAEFDPASHQGERRPHPRVTPFPKSLPFGRIAVLMPGREPCVSSPSAASSSSPD